MSYKDNFVWVSEWNVFILLRKQPPDIDLCPFGLKMKQYQGMLTEQMPYFENRLSWECIGVDKIILTSRMKFLNRNQAQPPLLF